MPTLSLLGNLAAAALLVGILSASGARLRKTLLLPARPSDRWATDLALGAGLCGLWVLALGLLGLLTWRWSLAGLALQAATGAWRNARRPWVALVAPLAASLPNLIIAAGPPWFYDAMVYHLGLPWQALMEGGWSAHPENLFAAFPPLSQLVSCPLLLIGADHAPALLHWFAWLVAAVAAGGVTRRLGAPRWSAHLVAAACMLLQATPLVPGFPAAEGWLLACLIPALAAVAGPSLRRPSVPGAALLLGFACAFRLQGLTWLAIAVFLIAVRSRSPRLLLRLTPFAVVGAAPWWLKNLVLLHDPVAPLFWHREGVETLWRDGASLLATGVPLLGLVPRLPELIAPAAATLLPLLAVAALAAVANRRARLLLWAALLGLAGWATTGALPRFLAPAIILLLAAAAGLKLRRIGPAIAAVVIGWSLALGLLAQLSWMTAIRPFALLGLPQAEAAKLVAPNPPFAAYQELASRLPKDARVLIVGEARGFGLPRRFIIGSQHDPSPIQELVEAGSSPADLLARLRTAGFTHLLVNQPELQRLASGYPVSPWRSEAGRQRWVALLRSLGKPVARRDGVVTYALLTETPPRATTAR